MSSLVEPCMRIITIPILTNFVEFFEISIVLKFFWKQSYQRVIKLLTEIVMCDQREHSVHPTQKQDYWKPYMLMSTNCILLNFSRIGQFHLGFEDSFANKTIKNLPESNRIAI